MSSVNCGAYVNSKRPKSKKALKEAIKNDPHRVTFDPTSIFDAKTSTSYYGDAIPNGVSLSVCGPDSYTLRKWYATVTTVNGNVKVT